MARIAMIYKESIVDGEGWRYAIFFQGCNHNCLGCHNPESHDFNGGKEMLLQDIKDDIKCAVDDNFLLDGITLSGGDPFFQAKEATELAKYAHELGLNVWVYTGFTLEAFLSFIDNKCTDTRVTSDMIEFLNHIDILVDGPFILAERNIEENYKGSTNQRILDMKKSLEGHKAIEYIC